MPRLLFVPLAALLLHSCTSTPPPALKLETMPLPEAIDGCSCLFALSDADFKAGKYVIATDMDSAAWVSVGGRTTQMALMQTQRTQEALAGTPFTDTYRGPGFGVRLDASIQTRNGDEAWRYTGKITLKMDDGPLAKATLVGECGC